jgi:spermidine synthase
VSTFAADAPSAKDADRETSRALSPLLFGTTILTSACLLFLVQPLASKLILPWFGGSAAVWITCMCFFQSALLLGYLYAHSLARLLNLRWQARVHIVLLLASLAALPILPNARWQLKPGQDPTWLVLGVLATSVGLPYVLLASTSPLLQSWYARTLRGGLPYRYFALSNAGSLIALLAYPIIIEPYWTGHRQVWFWSCAFVVFAALCAGTAVAAGRTPITANSSIEHDSPRTQIRAAQIALWLALAACASMLLLTVTNLLTQNIAPMPLLWVLPLSIYLFTFILSFESDRWYQRWIFLPLVLPASGCLAAGAYAFDNAPIRIAVPLLSVALFVCAMTCHGEVARLKPSGDQLTAFYLSLSAGGALGGMFVAFLAPHVFPAMYEYPIAFVSCPLLLLLVTWRERIGWMRHHALFGLWMAAVTGTFLLTVYVCRETWRQTRDATFLARNFYGALRVEDFADRHQRVRELSNGTITHGIQFLNPALSHAATTYYARESGIGLAWRTLAKAGALRMGVVGLGAGTVAAYGRAGDTLRFYDINPLVINIAKTQFSYLADCPAHIDVVLGDARLSLAGEPNQRFDMLVIDAFSGDAIPVHLLTREAFRIYWRHLKPDGVLAVHISNRYLNLAPVVLLAARESGRAVWEIDSDDNEALDIYNSSYVLVSSRAGFFDDALFKGELSEIDANHNLRTWTDDYSNLWQILKYRQGN